MAGGRLRPTRIRTARVAPNGFVGRPAARSPAVRRTGRAAAHSRIDPVLPAAHLAGGRIGRRIRRPAGHWHPAEAQRRAARERDRTMPVAARSDHPARSADLLTAARTDRPAAGDRRPDRGRSHGPGHDRSRRRRSRQHASRGRAGRRDCPSRRDPEVRHGRQRNRHRRPVLGRRADRRIADLRIRRVRRPPCRDQVRHVRDRIRPRPFDVGSAAHRDVVRARHR